MTYIFSIIEEKTNHLMGLNIVKAKNIDRAIAAIGKIYQFEEYILFSMKEEASNNRLINYDFYYFNSGKYIVNILPVSNTEIIKEEEVL